MKESIFSVMTRLANAYQAINLSQGIPEASPPSLLIEEVFHQMVQGTNQYAPMVGTPQLVNAIIEYLRTTYNVEVGPDELTVTSGATQAIFTAIQTLCEPDDEVLLFLPAYDSYLPSIQHVRAKPIFIHTEPPHFTIPWDEVKKRVTPKTKVILLNSPHNPGTRIWSEHDYSQLIEIVEGTSIIVIGDEVYNNLIYDGFHHRPLLSFPELRKQSVSIFSGGKLFNATGWKVGWAVASPPLTKRICSLHQFIVFCVNPAVQNAIAKGLSQPVLLKQIRDRHEQLRRIMYEELRHTPFTPILPQGTYFMLIDYSQVSQMPDVQFAMELVKKAKVATIPLSPFYAPFEVSYPYLRLCFSKKESTIKKGIGQLNQFALAQ
jgi:methionine aminotransferase